jgi:hypothetical protein
MDCDCPIWIHGRTPTGDIVPRQSTQFSDLKRAEALRASLMAQVQTESMTGPPLSECIEKYLATREQDIDARTLNQHRLALERLQRFLEAQNIIHIREITVDHLETFKTAGLPKADADDDEGHDLREDQVFSPGRISAGVDQRGARR